MSRFRKTVVSALMATAIALSVIVGPALPPVAYLMNMIGCKLVEAGFYSPAISIFSHLADWRNPDGLNNLGVMYRRGWGVRCDVSEARLNFERALARGHHVQAAYNLSELVSGNKEASDRDVKASVALLEANVAQGDIHSSAALATRIYKLNGHEFLPVNEDRKYKLLEAASETDVEYRLLLADRLIDRLKFSTCSSSRQKAGEERLGCSALALKIWRVLSPLHEAGDARATIRMAEFRREVRAENVTAEKLTLDYVAWLKLAADRGHATAECDYAIAMYGRQEKQPAHIAATTVAMALPYLKRCAERRAVKGGRCDICVVEGSKLLMWRRRPFHFPLSIRPGWASVDLGELYATGRGVPRDLDKARGYFTVAADVHKFDEAKKRLKDLAPSVE